MPKCEHQGCECEAPQRARFCSEKCREAQASGQAAGAGGCGCGHPDCEG